MKRTVCGVGYIGYGPHRPYIKRGKPHRVYVVWRNMLQRCYDERSWITRPTYERCTVVDEWHNYQNFCEWYHKTYPSDGEKCDLDKDGKVPGNIVYGPETCEWISPVRNVMIARGTENTTWVFKHKKNR